MPTRLRDGFELRDGVARPSATMLAAARTVVVPARLRAAADLAPNELDLVVTTETPDSYGDVVLASGCDWSRFEACGSPITRQHETSDPPIAVAVKRWEQEIRTARGERRVRGWAQRWRFNVPTDGEEPDEIQAVALAYLNAYRSDFMRCASIHFVPKPGGAKSAQDLTPEEREAYGLGDYGVLWEAVEILSVGAVSIPANPDCVKLSACTPAEFRALVARVESLERELTETRSRDSTSPAARTAADAATRAEGGSRTEGAARRAGPASPAAPSPPSRVAIAALLSRAGRVARAS